VKKPPFCSVIIPTHSRPAQLTECIEALAGLDYPSDDFEVVVVDDGSEPPVTGLAETFDGGGSLTVVRQDPAGPAAARNAGAKVARGEILLFTDDDCRPDRGWLRVLAEHLRAFPSHMAGGRTINALPWMACSAASQTIIDAVYAHYNAEASQARFFTSNNVALSAERFREIGGFDASFRTSEDRELCDRWLRAGGPMFYLPGACIFHAHHLTLAGFLKQHFHYGEGACRLLEARLDRGSTDFNHAPNFYAKFLVAPLAERPWWRALRGFVLLSLSQVASLMGFAWEKIRTAMRATQCRA
jgi:GT2 family glycosyltransferase